MKAIAHIALAAAVLVVSHIATAAQVVDARLNERNQTIELDVIYSGGCEEHDFELKVRRCSRTSEKSCIVELTDLNTTDSCRRVIETTIDLPADNFISDESITHLVILGSENSAVELPFAR